MKITIEISDEHYNEFLEGYQKTTKQELKEAIKEFLYDKYYKGKKQIAIEDVEPDVITTIIKVF